MKSPFDLKNYRIESPTPSFNVSKRSTLEVQDKKEMKALVRANKAATAPLQKALYAEATKSILFVFQAMDAAGKDSTIEKVFSGINPQGFECSSFKKPTTHEQAHDYLWRVHKRVPAKGNIGIFNRSHYEEVLVTKVYPEFIMYQNLPGVNDLKKVNAAFWNKRYSALNAFEEQLEATGTKVVKFFLNVSKEEQKRRLYSRMDTPEKNWKVNVGDTLERAHWEKYQEAYTSAIKKTATKKSPWYVIPADDKWTMRALVSSIVLHEMKRIKPQFPGFSDKNRKEMTQARKILNGEK